MALEEALKRFQDQTGKPLKFLQAFHVLKEAPKYKMIGAAVPSSTVTHSESLDELDIERPPGNKRAKKDSLVAEQRNEQRRQLAEAARDLVRIAEEKKQIAEDQLAFQLFSSDPNSDESKEFMKLKRQEYLAKYKLRLEQ
jgi:hypothetical protein